MLKKMVGEEQTITSSSKVDLSKLPPCRRSLVPHIRRVNYRAGQWKLSHVHKPEIPTPTDHGWVILEGTLEPVWSEGPVLPARLVDILCSDHDGMETDEDSGDSDVEGPETDLELSSDEDSDN